MNRIQPLTIICFVFILDYCLGCGYTILCDIDEEEMQAELVAIDSLTYAPDLTISNIEYTYIPPPPRDYLDRSGQQGNGLFIIKITNIGNTEFTKPYVLVFKNLDPRLYQTNNFYGIRCNQNMETISVNGNQVIKLPANHLTDSSAFTFIIVTNPIIQREVIKALAYRVNYPPIQPLSRELRYDNNDVGITKPGWKDLLRNPQHLNKDAGR